MVIYLRGYHAEGRSVMSGSADKALEELLEEIFKMIGSILKALFWGIGRGFRKMNSLIKWVGLLICILISAVGIFVARKHFLQIESIPIYIRWIMIGAMAAMPVIYVMILGGANSNKKYEEVFSTIGFKGKDGKFPYLIEVRNEGKKVVYIFKSNIPLMEWKNAKTRLETGFNCNILLIKNTNNKQIVRIVTVPADCNIPTMLPWQDSLLPTKNGTIAVGQSALDDITFDLNRVPHVLVAGETGSGKSVILRTCLWQMINQGSRVYMIDFKGGVEFGKQYEKYGEVVTERERALEILTQLCVENEARLKLFRELEVKNLAEYNKKTGQNLCRIGVFSDEIAEMLDKKGVSKELKPIYEKIEGKLSTLARLSRATGINLFLGVQRPDANVLTGQIKNNIPVRISGRFADKTASEIVLGNTAATELPDIKGRFLYKVGNDTIEFQSYYFDDETMLKNITVTQGNMLTQTDENMREDDLFVPEKMESSRMYEPAEDSAELKKLKEMYDQTDLNLNFEEE